MASCHSFRESLERGESARNEPFWLAVYQKAFPGLVSTVRNDCRNQSAGNAAQYAGIDRWLCMSSGKVIAVDEKVRDKDYGDILLEYLSNDRTNAPGWIEKDLAIDWLAYAVMPSKRCYLFPWLLLRRSWVVYGDEWKAKGETRADGFRTVSAPNHTYNTLSVAVPLDVLRLTIHRAAVVEVTL